MAEKKRQHTHPGFQLKRWAKDGKLSICDLQKSKEHDKVDPKTFLRKDHFYTLEFLEEERLIVDDFLGEVESESKHLIDKLIRGEVLTDQERAQVAQFIGAQKIRTPDTQEFFESSMIVTARKEAVEGLKDKKKFAKFVASLRKKGEVPKEVIDKLVADPSTLREAFNHPKLGIKNIKDVWVPKMYDFINSLGEDYHSWGWYVLKCCRKKHSFITSDNGVMTMTWMDEAGQPFEVEVVVPLDPWTCLLMKKSRTKGLLFVENYESADEVNDINLRMLSHARRFIVGEDIRLIRSLKKRYRKYWEVIQQGKEEIMEERVVGNKEQDLHPYIPEMRTPQGKHDIRPNFVFRRVGY